MTCARTNTPHTQRVRHHNDDCAYYMCGNNKNSNVCIRRTKKEGTCVCVKQNHTRAFSDVHRDVKHHICADHVTTICSRAWSTAKSGRSIHTQVFEPRSHFGRSCALVVTDSVGLFDVPYCPHEKPECNDASFVAALSSHCAWPARGRQTGT